MATFKTIGTSVETEFKDRGSRFIGMAFHINSKESIAEKLEILKEAHPKSRHVCYAYVLGTEEDYRANDDGEPSGSAGLPIYNQIRSAGVRYTLVAVVRYFGGTKLGVPGLINAYKTAAKEALLASELIEEVEKLLLKIYFEYADMEAVMSFIKSKNHEVTEQVFMEKCTLTIKSPLEDIDSYRTYLDSRGISYSVAGD